jgi:NAD(P)-dependent dehydrogenase (short-subunit alcohol dehydrogenase family)
VELELQGKTALITGASRGIGLGMAKRFVEAGANVFLSSRTADDLAAAVAGLVAGGAPPERLAWAAAHVGKPEQAQTCVAEAIERFGGLDILVNNAGTNPYFGPMIDIDLVRAQKTFEVNQLSVVVWTAAAVKAGLRAGGSIINVASIGGLGVEPGIGWYNVTKAAVLHLTRQFSFELAPDIRVNALAPGLVKTKLAAALWEGPGEDKIAAHIPLKRLGLPDDIAAAALFLASDASSWMTGQTIVVDGGTTAQPSGGVG